MVLTEQRDTLKYLPATVETATWEAEAKVYEITDNRRIPVVDDALKTHFQNHYYRTLGTNPQEKAGLGAVIKVMSGDQVGLVAESYYQPPTTAVENNKWLALNELLTAFTGSDAVKGIKGAIAPSDVNAITGNASNLQSFLQTPSADLPVNAHLAWILFDEQMHYVAGSTDPVSTTTDGYKLHTLTVPVTKNGYLYVYVANQSNQVVYFDNLALTHYKGPILEETHYYPFGLTMHGISSKAAGGMENKNKYNGIELENDLVLQTYDAFFRELDPQTGRWWQIDPKTENMEMWSPYASNYNNPLRYSDELGDEPDGCCMEEIKAVGNYISGAVVGTVVGGIDNLTGSNLRGQLKNSFEGTGAAGNGWNAGLNIADAGGVVLGLAETVVGGTGALGSGIVTLGTGGIASPVSIPVGTGSVALAAHGVFAISNSTSNLINQNGRVEAHGNSKNSNKPQHGYQIREKSNNELYKNGVSQSKLNKDGSSPRANPQVNRLNNQAGYEKYKATVVKKNVTGRNGGTARGSILDWEKGATKAYKIQTGQNPLGNILPKIF